MKKSTNKVSRFNSNPEIWMKSHSEPKKNMNKNKLNKKIILKFKSSLSLMMNKPKSILPHNSLKNAIE
jgi:hypothetical protein